MINIFNRRELIITYDINIQSKVRELLSKSGIDYSINPILLSWSINRCQAEYKIYVKKSDYEIARNVIKEIWM